MPKPAVLIVDSEALVRWSLSEALRDSGYPVSQTGPREAVAALAALGPAPVLILLDLRRSDIDWSLLGELRRTRPDAPVVAMTTDRGPEADARAVAMGVRRFLNKPFDVNDVAAVVREAWTARPRVS